MKNKTIAWQKYEDYIEKQISSPVLTNIMQNLMSLHSNLEEETEDDVDDEDYMDLETKEASKILTPFLPLTNQIINDITMLSSFDCWIGHTNFDITPKIKTILDSIEGVEVLKILSRYRFFIGIGKLFDFKEVRKEIEEDLL